MITVKAKINLTDEGAGRITSIQDGYSNRINISADIKDVIDKKDVSLGNPFILGKSKLGAGATYAKKLPYYVGRDLSNENGNGYGETNQVPAFIISCENLNAMVIAFDTENNIYPQQINIGGRVVKDDDAKYEISLDESQESYTITVSSLNKPNEPLIITGIYGEIDIDINDTNLVSFDASIFDRTNNKYPSYGLISNTANLTVLDLNSDILDFIKERLLHSGAKVNVCLENTDPKAEEQICEMGIEEITYDNDNKEVRFSLKDGLEIFQEISVAEIVYWTHKSVYSTDKSDTAKFFYNYLRDISVEKTNLYVLKFEELDIATRSVLEETTIKYALLDSDNLWNCWNKLCQLCLLHMYIDNANMVVVKYSI